ncbi:hypothetical protein FACS189425_07360 [Clostridia bacterium]|nr:hypothetical protein FACS189425_07360 [Clostridia bacterium]
MWINKRLAANINVKRRFVEEVFLRSSGVNLHTYHMLFNIDTVGKYKKIAHNLLGIPKAEPMDEEFEILPNGNYRITKEYAQRQLLYNIETFFHPEEGDKTPPEERFFIMTNNPYAKKEAYIITADLRCHSRNQKTVHHSWVLCRGKHRKTMVIDYTRNMAMDTKAFMKLSLNPKEVARVDVKEIIADIDEQGEPFRYTQTKNFKTYLMFHDELAREGKMQQAGSIRTILPPRTRSPIRGKFRTTFSQVPLPKFY